MPGTVADPPSVSLSFANNFWGKDDAGVTPLLDRMHSAKVTSNELKAFYTARASLEEDYARKLLSLARKPLGSSEAGTLRMSLDVVRGEVEAMGKAHQNVAQQMRTELEEQLSAFAGGMNERRKIVQGGIEKLLKSKTQQTATLNKSRDKYEQDCLKIKGYLAQGHMVMGQEERKNKAKLEKTQIQLSTTSNEYQSAVKVVEETTGRWNRDWKVACDKFQDLEEERIDFTKNSLWSFANIASTVCVSDDASCEKMRLSLEDCDVEKDISCFIKDHSTGQEIPDPPKFIDFCRGDVNDNASDVSVEDTGYSVAQFQRTMNPAFRSSSPQPSTFESHHDPDGLLAQDMRGSRGDPDATPRRSSAVREQQVQDHFRSSHGSQGVAARDDLPQVPHNEYPMDGMTQFCRLPAASDNGSSVASPVRPLSRDSHSDLSFSNSFTSPEPSLGTGSPTKGMSDLSQRSGPDEEPLKKKSGFFSNRSPFKRKDKGEMDSSQSSTPTSNNRSSWQPASGRSRDQARQPPAYSEQQSRQGDRPSASPEPADPRADFQLNIGNNVFDVASPDARRRSRQTADDGMDEVAQALAAVKGMTKQSTSRVSADRYAGLATPAPSSSNSGSSSAPRPRQANLPDRTAPPPSYNPAPVSRLDAPQPAHTSRHMQQTTASFQNRNSQMLNGSAAPNTHQQPAYGRQPQQARPPTRGPPESARAPSPAPRRSPSPRPGQGNLPRAASPNPYLNGGKDVDPGYQQSRPRAQSSSPIKPRTDVGYGNTPPSRAPYAGASGPQRPSPNQMPRAASPQPGYNRPARPHSGNFDNMAMQLAPAPGPGPQGYQGPGRPAPGPGYAGAQPRGRMGGAPPPQARPMSTYGGMQGMGAPPPPAGPDARAGHARSQSAGAGQQFTRDGRAILHFSRALFMYQAAIPEELSFAKNDVLAVLRHQDDGWWEAEIAGKRGPRGLVPSNYLQNA